jgi:putative sterol carrier protein
MMATPTKDQILGFYKASLQRSLDGYAKLDEKEWAKKTGEWTAKENLALMPATMQAETLGSTKQALAGEKIHIEGFESRSDMLPLREKNMRAIADKPTAELLQMLQSTFGEHIQMLEGASEADLDKPTMSPAWGAPGTVRDLFFASYLFLPAQYQEIRKANKKKLPHWIEASTPDQVNYHMGRLFHYMPLILRNDKAADAECTYLFTMEGEGGGQWGIAIDHGKAVSQDGAPEKHDVEIKTKPESWIDLSTGDLNPITAVMPGPFNKVKLNGQMGLALKLSEYFGADA